MVNLVLLSIDHWFRVSRVRPTETCTVRMLHIQPRSTKVTEDQSECNALLKMQGLPLIEKVLHSTLLLLISF